MLPIPKRQALNYCEFPSVSSQDCDFPFDTVEHYLTAAGPVSKATSSSPTMPWSSYALT